MSPCDNSGACHQAGPAIFLFVRKLRKCLVVDDFNEFTIRLEEFQIKVVPRYHAYVKLKKQLLDTKRHEMKLEEFKPRVLTSFVRNKLINDVYLPLVGDNLAKQIGTVGEIIRMAEQDDPQPATLEGNYSIEQLNELVAVVRKLLTVRDVLLKVNELYIRSAAQADEYRTEPAFKLQGSYRDMNKLAERVVPIMNDSELHTLIMSHFENQAQTLTTGAEANMLKFKELIGTLEGAEVERWDDITRTYKRNLLLGGAAQGDDKLAQVIAQMTTFTEGLAGIEKTLKSGMSMLNPSADDREVQTTQQQIASEQISNAVVHLAGFNENLSAIRDALSSGTNQLAKNLIDIAPKNAAAEAPSHRGQEKPYKIQVVNKIPKTFLDVIRTQFYILQTWVEPLMQLANASDNKDFRKAIEKSNKRYEEMLNKIQGDDEIE